MTAHGTDEIADLPLDTDGVGAWVPLDFVPTATTVTGTKRKSHRFARYLLRRALVLIPQLLGILFVTFALIRLLPGDPARQIAGQLASEEQLAKVRADYGFDQPVISQFFRYIGNVARGDLGVSFRTGQEVRTDLLERLPATLEILITSLTLALVIGVLLGVWCARHQGSRIDKVLSVYSKFAGALPEFFFGILLIFVFFVQLGWAPPPLGRIDPTITPPNDVTHSYVIDSLLSGNFEALGSSLGRLVLPVLAFTVTGIAPFLKMTRSSTIEVSNSLYIRQAAAMGLPNRTITRRALKNALPPVVTLAGFLYSYSLGGAVLIEQLFGWGGMGQYAVQSILGADYLAIQGFVLVAALISLLVYTLVDIAYFVLDPRIKA